MALTRRTLVGKAMSLLLSVLPRLVLTCLPRSKRTAFIVRFCCLVAAAAAASLQSRPTLRDPRDGSPPGSPAPGILQARTLERVAIAFSSA